MVEALLVITTYDKDVAAKVEDMFGNSKRVRLRMFSDKMRECFLYRPFEIINPLDTLKMAAFSSVNFPMYGVKSGYVYKV